MAWDNTYESSPRNTNNPGYGAAAIRDLKTDIRTRLEKYFTFGFGFGGDDTQVQGTPKEGSARIAVLDGDELNRDDIVASTTGLIGQMRANITDLTTPRKADDVNLPLEDDQVTKKISIVREDSILGTRVVDVFDYDAMVDVKQDQTVGGRKTFTLPPLVTGVGDWDAYKTANVKLTAGTNFAESYANQQVAKFHNYMAYTAENKAKLGDTGTHINVTIQPDTVVARAITADTITGVVWV